MVGEIRDRETADIAVQAALTGHLVLSTVHTNDAVGAITRLRDMKVEPFLIASTVRAVIAQRLVRRLCTECRAPVEASGSLSSLLGLEPGTVVYEPKGCAACGGSGYKGRIGVFEAVRVDDEVRRLINARRRGDGDLGARVPVERHADRGGAAAGPRGRRPVPRRRCGSRAARRKMPEFAYLGLDTAGRERRGQVRAETSEAARDQLVRRKLYVVKIEAAAESAAPPLLSRGLFVAAPAEREAAHALHPPAGDADPGHAARRSPAHHLAPGRARGGPPRARQRPCRRGRGPAALRGDGARGGELPAALPGDGRGRRGLGHAAADPGAARQSAGAPGAGALQGAFDARLSDHPRLRRRLRGVRPDDLRGAQGGRAVPGYRPDPAAADPDRDRAFQLPRRLVVGAAAGRRAGGAPRRAGAEGRRGQDEVRPDAASPAADRAADPRSPRRADGADAVDHGVEPAAAAGGAEAHHRHGAQPRASRRQRRDRRDGADRRQPFGRVEARRHLSALARLSGRERARLRAGST